MVTLIAQASKTVRQAMMVAESRGFTLIEVLLVVAIITIITTVGAPVFLGLQSNNELDVATNTLAQYLYQAQSNSRGEAHDCSWGVTFNGQDITLFCGNSFAGRDTAYDTSYAMPNSITVQTNQEIVYSKLQGLPLGTGTFSLKTGNNTVSIAVNAEGMVEY